MDKGLLLLLVGSSGSGKNTIIKQLTQNHKNVKFLISHTTREMRENEKEGAPYHFVTKEQFETAIANDEMLEYDITHRGYYGISKQTIHDTLNQGKVVIKDISILGLLNCRKQIGHKALINSVFLTERKSVLRKRLIKRGEKNYKLRLKIYKKEQSQMGVSDYIIKNSNLEYSITLIEAIINLATNNLSLLPYNPNFKVNTNKLENYISAIENGKKLKPYKVVAIDNKIYILNGIEKYLASLKTGKIWAKKFVNKEFAKPNLSNEALAKWQNIINN